MKKHDEHYAGMDVQPIVVMEERMEDFDTVDDYPDPGERFLLALSLKHIMRAGKKEGQPWRKDVEKAINYLHRSLNGTWASKG